jgi:hypothetical protein
MANHFDLLQKEWRIILICPDKVEDYFDFGKDPLEMSFYFGKRPSFDVLLVSEKNPLEISFPKCIMATLVFAAFLCLPL